MLRRAVMRTVTRLLPLDESSRRRRRRREPSHTTGGGPPGNVPAGNHGEAGVAGAARSPYRRRETATITRRLGETIFTPKRNFMGRMAYRADFQSFLPPCSFVQLRCGERGAPRETEAFSKSVFCRKGQTPASANDSQTGRQSLMPRSTEAMPLYMSRRGAYARTMIRPTSEGGRISAMRQAFAERVMPLF